LRLIKQFKQYTYVYTVYTLVLSVDTKQYKESKVNASGVTKNMHNVIQTEQIM